MNEKRKRGRPRKVAKEKKPTIFKMKTLSEILVELQALDTTILDNVVAGLQVAITDLTAFIAAGDVDTPDPVVSVTTVTASGVSATFVPKTA